MSKKRDKDVLIIPTKEEIDKEFPKFDDSIYSSQAIIDMIDKHIAFNKKHGLSTESIQRIDTINSLWCIAEDMRLRKEAGEFPTYMEAYRWAAKHITQNGKTFKAYSLQNEYHKAKTKGLVGLD
ncbi:uncharacterized protein METZ01_LOCUS455204 [marine metagenome]|uniref:Uncharacterized protein n=1 Tax=marine metagenome TaxID=408172 RepID=A0A383A454_9ZZZZ